jgi:2-polyprenyl-3-methyl-5-hydroxy-6-metoxy-1,4-benzoquinol methylase
MKKLIKVIPMIDFSQKECMLCASKGLTFVNNLRDDDLHFAAVCPACGHVQVTPLPTVEEDIEFYQKNEMNRRLIPKSQLNEEQMMLKYEIWGIEQFGVVTNLFTDDYLSKGKILEIGSGYGWFVDKMRKAGYAVDGIELSDEKQEMAKKYLNLKLLPYNLLEDALPKTMIENYDVVCMFHVLEHILDPQLFLERSLKALKKGGKLLIAVPNYFDHLKQFSKEYNNFAYFRTHLSYFKPATLQYLLQKVGLTNIQIEGTQLYSLENAIHWLRNGVPYLEKSQIEMPEGLQWIGDIYKKTLEKQLKSDGLIAIGTK